jgi:plasmid stabilization system protein ParE
VVQIVYARNAIANLAHAFEFLLAHDPQAAIASAVAIREGVELLANHPLIGRRVEGELRELVISFGKTGYVALDKFIPAREQIRNLAIRLQRELDYPT